MNQYKIGQLAKVMGVSTHLLKHYEKFGLVVPIVDESTNYRYYDISQCSRIIESKKYRNIGFSLNDIAELMNHDSNDEVNRKVNEQIIALEDKIKELELQKRMAETFLSDSRIINQNLNQWFIEYCPNYMFLKQTEDSNILENGQCITEEYNLLDQIPLAKSALYISRDSLSKGQMSYSWGIVKQEELTERAVCCDCYFHIESCRCFVTYLAIEKPYIGNQRLLDQIKEQYAQFGGEITSDILAIRYKIVHDENRELHYFQVYIPLNLGVAHRFMTKITEI